MTATKRPWRLSEQQKSVLAADFHTTAAGQTLPITRRIAHGITPANAALIVRAVNWHDELVKTLDEAFDFLGGIDDASELRGRIIDILARARGEQP